MLGLLAQIVGGYSLVHLAILIIVIAGVIGIVFVITKQVGIQIPPFIVTVCWIILAVVIGVVAIRVISSML